MFIISQEKRDEFLRGIPRKYRGYTNNFPQKSIKNKEDILYAVVNLYRYGVPFLNQGRLRQERMNDVNEISNTLLPFVNKIWNYFNNKKPNTENTQENFDVFQEELCDLFIVLCEQTGFSHTYGNAQKMVNMLFKYFTCFSDYEEFSGLFIYCHIPIDRRILVDFHKVYHVENASYGNYRNEPWTRMSKENYLLLLEDYRRTFSLIKGEKSWLGVEYYVWTHENLPTTGEHTNIIKKFYK